MNLKAFDWVRIDGEWQMVSYPHKNYDHICLVGTPKRYYQDDIDKDEQGNLMILPYGEEVEFCDYNDWEYRKYVGKFMFYEGRKFWCTNGVDTHMPDQYRRKQSQLLLLLMEI